MYENKLLITMSCDGMTWVQAFDESLAQQTTKRYHSVDELPQSVQERIAVLSMLKHGESIPGIGRRLGGILFEIFEVIDDGDDTRGES
jgi:hypothetical protein